MKKKKWLIPVIISVLIAVLIIPVPSGVYKDGGTRTFSSLTYKIVKWRRLIDAEGGILEKTSVYFFPKNLKSLNELWEYEKDKLPDMPDIPDEPDIPDIPDIPDVIEDNRNEKYTGEWLDKSEAERCDDDAPFEDIVITDIYSDCFFASSVIPMPFSIKINGTLSEQWCVGDQVVCTYENVYRNPTNERYEADMTSIKESTFEPDPDVCYKPVIYLYPEEKTDVSVKLTLDGALSCTYPAYNNRWNVTASPDGTLTDEKGQTYNYLYWEGEARAEYDFSEGFCVKGSDTAAFLEAALSELGLNRKEANEFIVYWLPLMEQNSYNIISFQKEAYTDAAKLDINPAPDTLIRVFMAWKASERFVDIPAQTLSSPERNGFTVVEWGGTVTNH